MVTSLPNILPINIVGTVSGTVASGTPTSVFSPAAVQNVVIVNEDPINVDLISGGGIGSRVKGVAPAGQSFAPDIPGAINFSDPDEFDTDNWHDAGGGNPANTLFVVPAGEDGLYTCKVNFQGHIASSTNFGLRVEIQRNPLGAGSFNQVSTYINTRGGSGNVLEISESLCVDQELDATDELRVLVSGNNNTYTLDKATFSIVKLGDQA